jgi:hypothetical protein
MAELNKNILTKKKGASLMTMTESHLITAVIDAKQSRDVMTTKKYLKRICANMYRRKAKW